MKRLAALFAAIIVLSLPALAQTKHAMLGVSFGQAAGAPTATLTWQQLSPLPTGTTVNVYRCAGTCTALTAFTPLVTGIAPTAQGATATYVDSSVVSGTYSYYVATVNGAQVSASSIVSGTLPLPAPTGLTVTVN